jgi:hypothetical protein
LLINKSTQEKSAIWFNNFKSNPFCRRGGKLWRRNCVNQKYWNIVTDGLNCMVKHQGLVVELAVD